MQDLPQPEWPGHLVKQWKNESHLTAHILLPAPWSYDNVVRVVEVCDVGVTKVGEVPCPSPNTHLIRSSDLTAQLTSETLSSTDSSNSTLTITPLTLR